MSETVKTTDGHQGELLCIKGNTAFIKENNGKVWYCPKTDIIENYDKKDYQIRNLQSQLDQQKAMWNELKEWIDNNINSMSDSANYRQKEQLKFVKQKMQELEKGENNEN